MKNYRKIQPTVIRKIFLLTILFTIPIVLTWSQTCTKTTSTEQGKPVTEKLSEYIWNGNLEMIQKLVDENIVPVNTRLENEETMLTISAWQGYYDIAAYLVSKGANVNCRNDWQNTPLHNAAQKGYNDIISLLLEHGAMINARGTIGNNSLHFAVENEHLETARLLLKAGIDMNAENDYKQIPILQASWRGNASIMKLLVENGADVNFATADGNTIVQNLAYGGHTDALRIVLESADINRADSNGKNALHYACINKKPESVGLLLGRVQNIDLQERNLGNTPLHISAINGDLKSTELLIKSGADTKIKNYSGKTALDYAVQYGYTDIVSFYISNSNAPDQSLVAARNNQSAGLSNNSSGEAKVIYCGHSGWVVQTEKHLLVFDYWERNSPDQHGLANGSIDPAEIKDREVIVFVSHDHSDHYDTIIYDWKNVVGNITYVYGFKPEESWIHKEKGYHGPAYEYIDCNQTKNIAGVTITSHKSNDSGQGFLVKSDGLSIYHPGDHAMFTAEDGMDFRKEVDFIATLEDQVDIAFLPVSGCPSRWKKEFIVEGFFYSIDKLNPGQVFPMHALQQEYTTKEFAELAEKRMVENQIVCTENKGDSFQYNKNMVAIK